MSYTLIFITIFASLLSGILGSILSLIYMNRMEKRKLKIDLTRQLLGHRFSIQGEQFSSAMNQVIAIFHDEPRVLKRLEKLHSCLKDPMKRNVHDAFIDFLQECCIASKIYNQELERSLYIETFNAKD
ncbi:MULTISPECIES: hypothetical protein [Acinetobacter]|nr:MULTISPECIES: hypothetical protein [Acinetobacter]UNW05745.1 hypothetical protein MOW12_14990 [Acinetobacter indicus]